MTAWTRHREKGHGSKTSTVGPGKPRHSSYRGLGLFQQLRSTMRPMRFSFGVRRQKTCQRIRVKCFQSVGFRSSIDFNFSRQLFLVTTHSRFGVFFWIKLSKSADNHLKQTDPDARPCEAPREQRIQCNEGNKTHKNIGFEGFWLTMCAPYENLRIFV